MKFKKIILASGSPRRKELLGALFTQFEIIPAQKEENYHAIEPGEIVKELSLQKAEEVFEAEAEKSKDSLLVIGADTIVVKDGKVLGKPKDKEDACHMLKILSGETHQVYTGLALCYKIEDKVFKKSFFESTDVSFWPMSEEEIASYVATGDPMDKAGAYGIQSGGSLFVKEIKGDYLNVVGLPISRLYQELKSI
jgi:septum formation protein